MNLKNGMAMKTSDRMNAYRLPRAAAEASPPPRLFEIHHSLIILYRMQSEREATAAVTVAGVARINISTFA
jgi:hypothetical protein